MHDAVRNFRMKNSSIWPDQGPSIPSHLAEEPQFAALQRGHKSFDLHIALEHASPGLAIQDTSPTEKPRAKRRKMRRQFYDENTILTHTSRKKALEDPNDFLLSADEDSIYKKEVISLKPHFLSSEEPHLVASKGHPHPRVIQSPTHGGHGEMEIEHFCDYEGPTGSNPVFEVLPSLNGFLPLLMMSMTSLIRKDESVPATINDFCRLLTNIVLFTSEIISKNAQNASGYSGVKGLQLLSMFPGSLTLLLAALFENILLKLVSAITSGFNNTFLREMVLKALVEIGLFINKNQESDKAASFERIVIEKIVYLMSYDYPAMPLLKIHADYEIGITSESNKLRIIRKNKKRLMYSLSCQNINLQL
ncbi:hypothetical protein ACH5RR_036103 [Cinchona calisaya]|uniref:Uncharacterized protein n=1 Tax=Cinchona calisaya TaxID=153742 RepID=A0ABD2Y5T5_9GENT